MRYGDPVTVFDEHCVGDSKELMKKIEILSSEIEKPYCESRFNSQNMVVYDEVNNFKKLFKEPRIIGCKNSDFYLYQEKQICNLATVLTDLKFFFKESNWNYYSTSNMCALFSFMFIKSAGTFALQRLFKFSQKLSRYLHTNFQKAHLW